MLLIKKIFKFGLIISIIFYLNSVLVIAQSINDSPDSTKSKIITLRDSSSELLKYDKMPEWYEMITNIPGDISKYFQVTLRSDKIPLYLTVSALTAAAIATDHDTWEGTHKFHTSGPFNTKFDEFWTEVGDGRTQFGLAFLFGTYGLITKDVRAVRTASEIVQTVIASGAVVQVLKHITGRQTPNTATSPSGNWVFFPNQIDYAKHVSTYDAFPSGHVTTTLAAFTVIAENYSEIWWIRPVCYTITALVAYGMVGTGIHWYSDYPLAVAFGYTFGMIAAHPEGIPGVIAGKNLHIMPTLVENGFGLSFGYSF